jgi:TonB family protein
LYRSSDNPNYTVTFLVILFHVLLLLWAFVADFRKKVVADYGVATGPIFVDLYRGAKLKNQTQQSSKAVYTDVTGAQKKQNPMETEGGQALTAIGFHSEGMEDLHPAKIDGPKPHYPLSSRRLREEGVVVVRLCISPSGGVERSHIQKSSGHQNLDHSALSALSKWRFSASSMSQKSSPEGCFRFPVQFTLRGSND